MKASDLLPTLTDKLEKPHSTIRLVDLVALNFLAKYKEPFWRFKVKTTNLALHLAVTLHPHSLQCLFHALQLQVSLVHLPPELLHGDAVLCVLIPKFIVLLFF